MVGACSPCSSRQYAPQCQPRAAVVRAAPGVDVDHTNTSMPLAVSGSFAALDIERRERDTRVVQALLAPDVHHANTSMTLAVSRSFAALDVERRERGTSVV